GLLEGSQPRPDLGRPRLPIDRVFTISGFGTVGTGTLVDGSIKVGDEMQTMPGGRLVRVRGLQRHNQKVESVGPGSRVAANLSGVDKGELSRGDVLANPGTIQPARRIDATLTVITSAPHAVRHGAELLLHTGTAEVGCRVIVLDADEIGPGAVGWVQLYLDRPIAAAVHDRFVLRVPSPAITIAGGSFIDVAPRKHPRHDSAVRESLVRRAAGNVLEEELRKYPRGVTVGALLKATVAPETDVERLQARRLGDWIFSDDAWQSIAARAAHELSKAGAEMVRALARSGEIVRVSDDVAFAREAYESAVAMVKEIVAAGGSVTVAQLRDRMGASRRPVLALLEYLDAQRVTRRVGDARLLR